MSTILDRARNYVSRMPSSAQGSQGSAAIFNVACVLVKGFALTDNEAFKALVFRRVNK